MTLERAFQSCSSGPQRDPRADHRRVRCEQLGLLVGQCAACLRPLTAHRRGGRQISCAEVLEREALAAMFPEVSR